MPEQSSKSTLNRRLLTRPTDVVAAEQKRHDRALTHGLIAFFSAMVIGGGLAVFITYGPLLRGMPDLQNILACLVFVVPVLAAFTMLVRVPPLPFEALGDPDREMERKLAVWRANLASQSVVFGLLGAETFWFWPRANRMHGWVYLLPSVVPMSCMVFLVIMALYVRPGWLNADLSRFLDDEVTRSFRARAQRLGYLLLLFILMGLSVVARINPKVAAQFMPLGLAAGGALPILYFVYLDWQASRGG
jgi:hypothetical protein